MKSMSIMTTEEYCSHAKKLHVGKVKIVKETAKAIDFPQLTVSTIVKTMLEIIKVQRSDSMDDEAKKQFPVIAKEIILLAEQTQ